MPSNLRTVRRSKKLSLMGLAHKAGTTPSWLTFVERYAHVPGPDLRQRIAEALGVAEEELWPEQFAVAEVSTELHTGEQANDDTEQNE